MADIEAGQKKPIDLGAILQEGGSKAVVESLRNSAISLVGKTTCAYSLEAQTTLAGAAASIGGADAITSYWLDTMTNGAAIQAALKTELGQSTVPFVFINGEFIGGCDATKNLHAAGTLAPKIWEAAAAHKLTTASKSKSKPTNITATTNPAFIPAGTDAVDDLKGHMAAVLPDDNFADPTFRPATAEGTRLAYLPPFWFSEVIDSNVIRLTSFQVCIVCILGIIFRKHTWAHYMILGLALDSFARLLYGAGPSPLGQMARCISVAFKMDARPGIPKAFAVFCGTFMATVSTIFLFTTGFDSEEIIPSCFLAVFAFLAFLESAFDFCMGCVIFGFLVKLNILPKEVYGLGISTKPEAEYTYNEMTKKVELKEPEHVRMSFPGKPATEIDIRYKVKSNDHDRQVNDPFKHIKIAHFNIVLGLCGLATMWRLAAHPAVGGAAGMSIGNAPGDVIGIIATVVFGVLGLLYAIKTFKYPKKISKEWMCPLRSNSFVIPPACLVLLAFICYGRFDNSEDLAKVLFWIGAPITLLISLYLGARWITEMHSQEHFNPAWLMAPTACFVCSLVGPFLDADYTEACYLWFAFGAALAIPLYVITFQRSILFNEADDRNRPLKWTWVAAPAVACVAQTVLLAASQGSLVPIDTALVGGFAFDFASRVLYFISLSLGLMLGMLFLSGHASRLKFDPTSSWGIAFPLEALTLATLVYASVIRGSLPRGMGYAGLAISSWAVVDLALHTVYTLLMKTFFVADAKYGPLSQQILTHEAFRAAGEKLKVAVNALDPTNSGKINPVALESFALQLRRYRLAHAWHAEQEESVIFNEFEKYAPGLCSRQHDEHHNHEKVLAAWATAIEVLESSPNGGDATSKCLNMLRTEVPAFIDEFEGHLQGEEEHLQRGGRKQLNIDLQKQMLRKIWDDTPIEVWAEFLPYVVGNLPMHQQRVKFVRCWAIWALPERAQLIGRMIALGVDPNIWERLVDAVPEIAPRGERRWKRYY